MMYLVYLVQLGRHHMCHCVCSVSKENVERGRFDGLRLGEKMGTMFDLVCHWEELLEKVRAKDAKALKGDEMAALGIICALLTAAVTKNNRQVRSALPRTMCHYEKVRSLALAGRG